MRLFKVDWVYSGIDLGSSDMLVSKEFLNIADICSLLEKMGCTASSEAMRGSCFTYPSGFFVVE